MYGQALTFNYHSVICIWRTINPNIIITLTNFLRESEMLVVWECDRLCISFQFVCWSGASGETSRLQSSHIRLSRSSLQVFTCFGASLTVAKLPNICWLDRPGDTRLSYSSLPFSRIYHITVYGWPVWSLHNPARTAPNHHRRPSS